MREITKKELEELTKQNGPILLDIYGVWCMPCKVLLPKLEKLEKEYTNKVLFVKMDVQKNMGFAEEMGIKSVPTVLIYKGEELIEKIFGVADEQEYKSVLDTL